MAPTTSEWLIEQYYAGYFNLPNAHRHILHQNEHGALANTFASLAMQETSEDLRLERRTLVNHIQSQLPLDFPPSFADFVYRILAYHSTVPFYKSPFTSLPQSLSLQDVQLALVWLLPDRHLSMSNMGTDGRTRTRADHRRLLFQSLATRSAPIGDSPANEAARRRHAHRNAFEMEHVKTRYGGHEEYASINRDDDGDEMYHDLLDVLQKNVPENYPYGTMRDQLRPLAKELKADFEFHNLAVPRSDLTDFVRALLALQFETAQTTLKPEDLEYLDEAVASIMATFACDESDVQAAYPTATDLIAWPAFDQGLKQIPHLFDPVYRVLNDVLLNSQVDSETIPPIYGVPPELQTRSRILNESHVLSLGRMSLTNAILPPLIDWDSLHTVASWLHGPSALLSSDTIWTNIQPSAHEPDEEQQASILAFSGHVRGSGERFVGGVLAAADYDGEDGRDQIYSIYVFRLEPSVRYAKLLGQEWRRGPSGEMVFDNTSLSGFRLDIDAHVVRMDVPGGGGEQVIELDALEVWKDGE